MLSYSLHIIIVMIIILSTTCMQFYYNSPDGLVEPAALENGTYVKYDVVDVAEVARFHVI